MALSSFFGYRGEGVLSLCCISKVREAVFESVLYSQSGISCRKSPLIYEF